MPTIFSHALFAAATGKSFFHQPVSVWFWLLIAGCAMVPDADVISYSFGVERGTMFSHRGLTHSISFALLFGALIAFLAVRVFKIKAAFGTLFICFALAAFSHPLLDMLTNGGSGVALLAPFSDERFAFPFRPIEVSPIGFGFFSSRGLVVIVSEFIWLWLPSLALLLIVTIIGKFRQRN